MKTLLLLSTVAITSLCGAAQAQIPLDMPHPRTPNQAQQAPAPSAQQPSASESSESIDVGGVTLRLGMAQDDVLGRLRGSYELREMGPATSNRPAYQVHRKGQPLWEALGVVQFFRGRLDFVSRSWTDGSEPNTEAAFASAVYGAVTSLERESGAPCQVTTSSSQGPAAEIREELVNCRGRQKYLSITITSLSAGGESTSVEEILHATPQEEAAFGSVPEPAASTHEANQGAPPESAGEIGYANCDGLGKVFVFLNGATVATLACGQEVLVLREENGWKRIRTKDNIEGTVKDQYISTAKISAEHDRRETTESANPASNIKAVQSQLKSETLEAAELANPSSLVTIRAGERFPDEELVRISVHNRALCDQIITVAGLTPRGLALYVPPEGQKFMAKNSQDYPRMCLLEDANNVVLGVPRYLLVYAYSESAFAGFQPVTRINTTTTPVSGSGTVMNSYGGMWNFTYSGTVETTEMDTIEAPYVIRSHSLYLNAYDENGAIVSRHSFTVSSQSGGNGASALGYNGAQLIGLLWNNPSHLIKSVLKDVQKDSKKYSKN